jgi:hypothetical protein
VFLGVETRRFGNWNCFRSQVKVGGEDTYSQRNGPIRQVETCPDFFFYLFIFSTARVHTTKSTVKILAANKHCKYFLKIAEVTHFSVRGTACIRGLYNPS